MRKTNQRATTAATPGARAYVCADDGGDGDGQNLLRRYQVAQAAAQVLDFGGVGVQP